MGRVSKHEKFNYTTTQGGSYDLVFRNEFDAFSLIVWYSVTLPSRNLSLFMEVPFNETRFIAVELDKGQMVSGSFSVSGGYRYDDIHFFIRGMTCTQSVAFSFTLVNRGFSDGSALITLWSKGQGLWSNRYFVRAGEQMYVNETVSLTDCDKHLFNLVVSDQKKG